MKKTAAFRRKSLESILVKPAGSDCNMACTYCFYRENPAAQARPGAHRMTDEVLEETISRALSHCRGRMNFVWQGGEPTLMGLDFFRKAVELQKRHAKGKSVGNGLQTNGLLLDPDWADFLRENRFLVGLSLDGPEHVHNRYRCRAGGEGTWARVVDAARRLLQAGVDVNALAVVNDYSVRFPAEIYAFLKDLGLTHMQFIPCVERDPACPDRAAAFSAPSEAYGRFLRETFDLWMSDFSGGVPTTSIRFFESVFHLYVGLQAPECTLQDTCGTYVVVEADGGVYACDFFVEEAWKLGDIRRSRLEHLLNSPRQKAFGRMKSERPEDCRSCRWLSACRGGCLKDRIRDPRDGGLSHFCLSYRMFFEHAHDRLTELAATWRRRNLS